MSQLPLIRCKCCEENQPHLYIGYFLDNLMVQHDVWMCKNCKARRVWGGTMVDKWGRPRQPVVEPLEDWRWLPDRTGELEEDNAEVD